MSDAEKDAIDIMNKWMVGVMGRHVVILRPPMKPFTQEEALVLAAYLVSMTHLGREKFLQVLDAVENT